MKEAEIDALAMPWANARVAHLLSVCRMMTMEVGDGIMEEPNPDGYDQVMFTPECRDHRVLLLPHGAGEGRKGLYWRTYQHHGTSLAD